MTFIDERELKRAYLAGIFDGEGNLNPDGAKLHVGVSQANYPFLEYFKERYGGGSILEHGDGCWHWQLAGVDKQLAFLRDIEPYLILRRKEVLIAIEILKMAPIQGANLRYESIQRQVLRQRLYDMLSEAAELRKFGYREKSA